MDIVFDCIIIGAGPGGLQAAIYLGRFRRKVLLIDRGGGRTSHAVSIENYLTQKAISGKEIVELGMEQAKSFNVRIEKALVTSVSKNEYFNVTAQEQNYYSKFLIAASGVYDNIPSLENVHKFFAKSFLTCVDCDGYKTVGKKLVIIGNTIESVRLALAMKQMYTDDITLILYFYEPPDDYRQELHDEGIDLVKGEPIRLLGNDRLEAVELKNGSRIACEVVMSNFGFKLNDKFLKNLDLKRDQKDHRYVVNRVYESSLNGLYIVGPLNTGNDQVVISAGQGAVAAIDINKRLADI